MIIFQTFWENRHSSYSLIHFLFIWNGRHFESGFILNPSIVTINGRYVYCIGIFEFQVGFYRHFITLSLDRKVRNHWIKWHEFAFLHTPCSVTNFCGILSKSCFQCKIAWQFFLSFQCLPICFAIDFGNKSKRVGNTDLSLIPVLTDFINCIVPMQVTSLCQEILISIYADLSNLTEHVLNMRN